ncbi:MAG: hypothetical protein APF81_16875 [Desulfosporosinus sp. BRH_c37]|nr:MAG: hypothetical protein APF81_16875 [Desulfosporosinus sp. BRH_c37]
MRFIQGFILRSLQIDKLFNNKNKTKIIISLSLLLLIAVLIIYFFLARKSVYLIIDGKQENIITYKSSVKKVLLNKGIEVSSHDKLEPSLDSRISDKSTITLKHAVAVKVLIDGEEITKYSPEDNVESFLTAEGIVLGSQDRVNPEKNTELSDGLQIDVVRVEHKTVSTTQSLDFITTRKNDISLPNTYVQTKQEGKPGEKETIFDVVYENGKEISRKILSETVTKKPTDKIVVVGTFPLMPISRGGQQLDYKKVIKVKSTAYYAVNGIGKTYTSTGARAIRNPEGYSTIAVDPKVIPYGTKLFVEGYGFAIAADTGLAIRGNWIDVFFNTYREACNWSVKYVKVYIL